MTIAIVVCAAAIILIGIFNVAVFNVLMQSISEVGL